MLWIAVSLFRLVACTSRLVHSLRVSISLSAFRSTKIAASSFLLRPVVANTRARNVRYDADIGKFHVCLNFTDLLVVSPRRHDVYLALAQQATCYFRSEQPLPCEVFF